MDERLKTGPKFGAIFHDVTDRSHEFAVMESAKLLNAGTTSSKWQTDQAKMRKLMRDIIGALAIEAKHERRVIFRSSGFQMWRKKGNSTKKCDIHKAVKDKIRGSYEVFHRGSKYTITPAKIDGWVFCADIAHDPAQRLHMSVEVG
jgi:hypothetical protein